MNIKQALPLIIAFAFILACLALLGLFISPTWFGGQAVSVILVIVIFVGAAALFIMGKLGKTPGASSKPTTPSATPTPAPDAGPADMMNPNENTETTAQSVPLDEIINQPSPNQDTSTSQNEPKA